MESVQGARNRRIRGMAATAAAALTLPLAALAAPTAGVGNGITALHIFAMAIGSGTPTSG